MAFMNNTQEIAYIQINQFNLIYQKKFSVYMHSITSDAPIEYKTVFFPSDIVLKVFCCIYI